MEQKKDIMSYESVLPENFDGTFRFTNATDEDFTGKWGSKEYNFPAKTTSPIFMPNQTPLEIQSIRKKFAKDLAEREFYKNSEYKRLMKQEKNDDGSPRLNGIHSAGTYSIDQLTPYIQQCLVPLQAAQAEVREVKKASLEESLTRDEAGELNTFAVPDKGDLIEEKKSLKRKALGM